MVYTFGSFSVEIIDPVVEYLELLHHIFDFNALKHFISSRPDFRVKIDGMHGGTILLLSSLSLSPLSLFLSLN